MHPPTQQQIEERLSYAYLHAVAARAGASCEVMGRVADARGIDAQITLWDDFPNSYKREITFNIQLKATIKPPTRQNGFLGYSFSGIKRYNDLREARRTVNRFLVVLFLPDAKDQWLTQSADALILKRCAWWTSLYTAPATTNTDSVTVYLPKTQIFNVEAVHKIAQRIAVNKPPLYQGHDLHG